uniref:Basic tail secreted protein n=1 Tax=Rhipicephalus zambeziensis TaxID=60191 RepID=A0A224Y7J4_9ACAR
MAFAVSIRSAILAAVVVQAVFIGLSRPDSTSPVGTTPEPNITVKMCNATCHTAENSTCPGGCFCFYYNQSSVGQCMNVTVEDDDYYGTLPDNLDDFTPAPTPSAQ